MCTSEQDRQGSGHGKAEGLICSHDKQSLNKHLIAAGTTYTSALDPRSVAGRATRSTCSWCWPQTTASARVGHLERTLRIIKSKVFTSWRGAGVGGNGESSQPASSRWRRRAGERAHPSARRALANTAEHQTRRREARRGRTSSAFGMFKYAVIFRAAKSTVVPTGALLPTGTHSRPTRLETVVPHLCPCDQMATRSPPQVQTTANARPGPV